MGRWNLHQIAAPLSKNRYNTDSAPPGVTLYSSPTSVEPVELVPVLATP